MADMLSLSLDYIEKGVKGIREIIKANNRMNTQW